MAILGSDEPLIMGILNVTPDSFSDGGNYLDIGMAVRHAEHMLAEGADIIDIGGESTRPGADPVLPEEQLRRIIPVITAIRNKLGNAIALSIDTTWRTVAEASLNAGADMINDVSAGRNDPALLQLAAESKAPIVLMHSQGNPKTMQQNPHYKNVAVEVLDFLERRIDAALSAGIDPSNIIIDPGIGFGKRRQDNIDLLANLEKLVDLGYLVLLGASRKRFMGSICEVENPSELVAATAVTTALGVLAGVKLFRVHDVKENKQAIKVAMAIKSSQFRHLN